MPTTKKPSGEAPDPEAAQSATAGADGLGDTTEALPEATTPPATKPRCEEKDGQGRQCVLEQHSAKWEHQYDDDAPPKVAAKAEPVQVKRTSVVNWWCPVCDNAQLLTDRAQCRKCGAVPQF